MSTAYSSNTPSLGESRVRANFNPSSNSLVDLIKGRAAEFIDLCESVRPAVGDQSFSAREQHRLIALAQTSIEEAAMWAVKAATA